jgi:hypothetical protein
MKRREFITLLGGRFQRALYEREAAVTPNTKRTQRVRGVWE